MADCTRVPTTGNMLSPISPAENRRAQGGVNVVSVLPEGAVVALRLNFVIIGTNAREITNTLSQAELHTAVSAMMSSCFRGSANVGQLISSQSPSSQPADVLDLKISSDHTGTFCMVEPAENKVARVEFATVESFTDVLPALTTETGVRNSCFLFVTDGRLENVQDTLSVLNQGLAELSHSYERVKNRGSGARTPALRAVLLVSEARNRGSIPEDACVVDEEKSDKLPKHLEPFAGNLRNATKGSPVRGVRAVDLTSSDSLYELIEDLAREMYSINVAMRDQVTTRSSAQALPQSDEDIGAASRSSGPCCTAQ